MTAVDLQCVERQLNSSQAADEIRPTVVLLHGWGSGRWIWEQLSGVLASEVDLRCIDLPGYGANCGDSCESIDSFLQWFDDKILPDLPASFSLLGWSLGGGLATLIAARYPKRVQTLFTVATNPVFVAQADWPLAMQLQQFEHFQQQLDENPEKLLQRFNLLQLKGADHLAARTRWLAQQQADQPAEFAALQTGLRWLQQLDLRSDWQRLPMTVIHSYGANDSLVPVDVADKVRGLCPGHQVRVYAGASHLPFLDNLERWSHDFLQDLGVVPGDNYQSIGELIDKPAVAAAFDRAAPQYDRLAGVQQRVARDFVASIEYRWPENPTIVDLGSGTGFVARAFLSTSPSSMLQLDISRSMLDEARRRLSTSIQTPAGSQSYLQADIDRLPLAPQCVDGFLSSLSLQWSKDPAQLFLAVRQALKPQGYFGFTTLLPGSLAELAAAVKTLDGAARSHDFYTEAVLRELAAAAGFSVVQWRVQTYSEQFRTARELLDSVHGIGAGNHRIDRPASPLGKAGYQQLLAALQAQADESGQISLCYKVLVAGLVRDE